MGESAGRPLGGELPVSLIDLIISEITLIIYSA